MKHRLYRCIPGAQVCRSRSEVYKPSKYEVVLLGPNIDAGEYGFMCAFVVCKLLITVIVMSSA